MRRTRRRGTVVATIDATDPDAGDTLTFSLADDADGRFVIVGNEVQVADGADLDFEANSSHEIVVTVTDAAGLTRTETVTINVLNVDEAPTAIDLSGGEVEENAAAGTVVASLQAIDPDGPDGLEFALVDDADGRFEIVGNTIVVAASAVLDFEQQGSHSVTVEDDRPQRAQLFADICHRRSERERGAHRYQRDRRNGDGERGCRHALATLSAIDPDLGDTVDFAIDDPSGFFEVVGNEIRVAGGAQIDYETATSHVVTLIVTDASGESYQEELTIQVQNVAPVIIGTAGANTLTGTSEEDQIFGRAGNDTLSGLDGDDQLFGEAGNDRLSGGAGFDTLTGGLNNDTYVLVGSDAVEDTIIEIGGQGTDAVETDQSYTLAAEVENLVLTGSGNIGGTGNGLNNIITGNAGSNVLDGAAGADTMRGAQGDDVYYVDSASDVVTETSNNGFDEVRTALASYTLAANVEMLTYIGAASFAGTGNSRNNTITGGSGPTLSMAWAARTP